MLSPRGNLYKSGGYSFCFFCRKYFLDLRSAVYLLACLAPTPDRKADIHGRGKEVVQRRSWLQKEKTRVAVGLHGFLFGCPTKTRTWNQVINSHLLYH